MSDIAAHLNRILDRLDGALAASLVAQDGIAVESVNRNGGFDLEVLAAELLNQVRAISSDQADLAVGAVSHYSVSTDRYTIMIGALQPGYYLLLVLGNAVNHGRARYELRRAGLMFEEDLG